MLVPEFWQMLGYATDSDWFIQDTCMSFVTERRQEEGRHEKEKG
jgi:hypothetical protein